MPVTDTYRERLESVCDYIARHLDGDLSLEALSRVAGFSKYHFHRIFREVVGVSVFQYTQLLRLKRASFELVFRPDLTVLVIALQAGFESPEAFARAFKRQFQQTPSAFRADPQWEPWHQSYRFPMLTKGVPMNVKIVDFPQTTVAALEHRGSPALLMETVAEFKEWRKSSGLSPVASSPTFGVVYNDPDGVRPEDFRFDVCGATGEPIPGNSQGVVAKVIPGGRCATARHLGSRDLIGDSVRALYRDWLPQSGEQVRDFPVYFHYVNFFPEVPECDLVTDIYLPIK